MNDKERENKLTILIKKNNPQYKWLIDEGVRLGRTQMLEDELEFLKKGKFMFKDRHYTNPQSKKMQKELIEFFDERIKLLSKLEDDEVKDEE